VLDARGKSRSLHDLFGNHVVLLSFIYRSCDAVNGCPLAVTVFNRIRRQTARDSGLAGALRLITLSFDPERDTPEHMAHLARGLSGDGGGADWRFLTTASQAQLQPILDAYGQAVVRERGPAGVETGALAHVLRVFLIDQGRRIRNIYSPSFLHPELVVNDVRTLLAEAGSEPEPASSAAATAGPGDDKTGEARADYHTRSLSLAARRGRSTDLLANLREPPLGLPPVPTPEDSPVTVERISLGRKLFFDRRLSLNGTLSCAMCHIPEQGFTSNELETAVGIEGRTVRRNAPSLFNVGYPSMLFHDGRETRLKHQVWAPLLAGNEMGNPSIASVVEKLRRLPDYAGLFENAFGGGPDMETVGKALASYQRTLNCADSPFDRWYYGGVTAAVDETVKDGFSVFMGKGGCAGCHSVGPQHALFTDQELHNTGVGYRASMEQEPAEHPVRLAPGITLDVASALIRAVSETRPSDLGRYEITQDPDDRWRYKTPSLRNVALTPPYMHDGSIPTLAAVVDFYDRGGIRHALLDPSIKALALTGQEKHDLVAFLRSLTGSTCDALVADALAAPVGEGGPDDPLWWE
jgi:cytochrome c peroxidase